MHILQVGSNVIVCRDVEASDGVSIRTLVESCIRAVSYTHLDVYKRQAYQTARRIQKRPCRIGRRTSTSAIDWMGTAGRTSIRFYSFHSLIRSGKATSLSLIHI